MQWPAAKFQFLIDEYLIIGNKTKKIWTIKSLKNTRFKVGPLILRQKYNENKNKTYLQKNCLVVDYTIKNWYETVYTQLLIGMLISNFC